ncbi:MAG: hypothetical protein CMO55_13340 [Verrucomicrobiales bacterium]|nr:hypothetical protein [Verrucomicrobiales bacterium]
MSTFVKHEKPGKRGTLLALFLGALWAVFLGVTWYAYRNSEGDGGGFLNFIGRFHVLFVHFPIGIIFLALIMEFLSYFTAFSHLRKSIPFVLWLGFLTSIAATVMGYLLMQVEGFAGKAVDLHMYYGLAVVVFTLLALVFCLKGIRSIYSLSLLGAAFTTAASGHFGGAMVHEADYLTEHAPEQLKPMLLVGLAHHEEPTAEGEGTGEEAEEVPLGERVVYNEFVVPILEAKCNECHNENKIKGKLRMDTFDLLMAGAEGSDYPTVEPGNAFDSELIVRVTLDPDDDEFMPPKGEPLTEEETKLLTYWIDAGAKKELTVAELGEDPEIESTALAVAAIHAESQEEAADIAVATYESVWDTLSPEEQEQRMADVLSAAEKYHFSVMPISAEDERLRVNVINAAKEFGDEQLKLLEPVADQVIWLDLARSQITDEGLKTVGKMRGLERLHLENTKVTDSGIAQLKGLTDLEYLNLYSTEVGNGIFETFTTLPNLKKVYLWQTKADPAEARAFERSVNLEINTGAELASAQPEAAEPEKEEEKPAPKPEEKKPEEKKTEPKKPEAKKPEAKTAPAKPAPKKEEKKTETKPAPPKPEAKTEAKKPEPKADAKKSKQDTPPAPKKETTQPKKADTPPPKKADAPKPDTPPAPAKEQTEEKKKA